MKKLVGIGMAVVLALGIAATSYGAEQGARAEHGTKKEASTKTGVVKKVDAQAKTVTVMVTRELTFFVTDDTKIVQGDAVKTLADVKEGDTVTIVYTRESAEKRVATKITIGTAAAAPAPAPAK